MAAPELQRLALAAKGAAAILKYLPVTANLLEEVIVTLEALSAHPLWPARAAALVFVQVLLLSQDRFLPALNLYNVPSLKSLKCVCDYNAGRQSEV